MTGEGRKEFDGHSGQTLEEILALEEDLDQESLFSAIWTALWPKYDRVGLDGLSQEEKIVLAVMTLDFEVYNGGYHQFFTNSSREFSPIIVDALQRVGCTKAAGLTQQAIDPAQNLRAAHRGGWFFTQPGGWTLMDPTMQNCIRLTSSFLTSLPEAAISISFLTLSVKTETESP